MGNYYEQPYEQPYEQAPPPPQPQPWPAHPGQFFRVFQHQNYDEEYAAGGASSHQSHNGQDQEEYGEAQPTIVVEKKSGGSNMQYLIILLLALLSIVAFTFMNNEKTAERETKLDMDKARQTDQIGRFNMEFILGQQQDRKEQAENLAKTIENERIHRVEANGFSIEYSPNISTEVIQGVLELASKRESHKQNMESKHLDGNMALRKDGVRLTGESMKHAADSTNRSMDHTAKLTEKGIEMSGKTISESISASRDIGKTTAKAVERIAGNMGTGKPTMA